MQETQEMWGQYLGWEDLLESEVAESCPTLCDPMDCSPPGSSVHGVFQAIVLEWIPFSFSRGYSWLRDWTQVSHIAGRFFTLWTTRAHKLRQPESRKKTQQAQARTLPLRGTLFSTADPWTTVGRGLSGHGPSPQSNLQSALHIHVSSISTILHLWIQPT